MLIDSKIHQFTNTQFMHKPHLNSGRHASIPVRLIGLNTHICIQHFVISVEKCALWNPDDMFLNIMIYFIIN